MSSELHAPTAIMHSCALSALPPCLMYLLRGSMADHLPCTPVTTSPSTACAPCLALLVVFLTSLLPPYLYSLLSQSLFSRLMAPRSSTALPTGDPRRPLEAKKYKRPPPPKEEDMPPDLIGKLISCLSFWTLFVHVCANALATIFFS